MYVVYVLGVSMPWSVCEGQKAEGQKAAFGPLLPTVRVPGVELRWDGLGSKPLYPLSHGIAIALDLSSR